MKLTGIGLLVGVAAGVLVGLYVWRSAPAAALTTEQAAFAKVYERGVTAAGPSCAASGAKVITMLGKIDGKAVTFVGCVEP